MWVALYLIFSAFTSSTSPDLRVQADPHIYETRQECVSSVSPEGGPAVFAVVCVRIDE